MAEALQRVKHEFGRDAVILSTRTLPRSGPLGLTGKPCVEITAAPDSTVLPAAMDGAGVQLRARPPVGAVASASAEAMSNRGMGTRTDEALISEMGVLKGLVQNLVARTRATKTESLPPQLYRTYRDLVDAAFAEELALQLVERVQTEIGESSIADDDAVREKLLSIVVPMLPISGATRLVHPAKPTVVALVGPTGSGKTTTIAKLAANAVLRDRTSVGLITIDTYRIGAVDQLRTYAEIMNLPLEVICAPDEVDTALAKLADRRLILVDTAGRGQRDTAKIEELGRFFKELRPDEVHIVVSAGSSSAAVNDVIDRFRPLGFNRVLFTKLDEAVGLGIIMTGLQRAKVELSYVTTGQDVPNDIAVGEATSIARMILADAQKMPCSGTARAGQNALPKPQRVRSASVSTQ